jgi:hypothetical protein
VLAFVDDATFAIFRQAFAEVVELLAFNKAKSEFQSKVGEMRRELMRVQSDSERRIHRHRLHICENILTLKCPRPACGLAVLDFDGCVWSTTVFCFILFECASFRCFAVSCICGCSFCAWCMADCGRDAHAHVRRCPSNANPGTYHGTVAQFDKTNKDRRRIAVQQFLHSLPQGDAEKVRRQHLHLCKRHGARCNTRFACDS